LETLTVKLSPEAVKAVLAYEKATGFDLGDIASGILVGAIGDPVDWQLQSEDVLEAAALRKRGGDR
jgi:hypothetical protein